MIIIIIMIIMIIIIQEHQYFLDVVVRLGDGDREEDLINMIKYCI